MRRQIAGVGALVCLFTVVPAYADGLIFQLPADGTWARYAVQIKGEGKVGKMPAQRLATTSTLTVSSVGEVTRHEQKCRWIELIMESKGKGVHPKLVLKMLIPEEYLKRGQDPLSHAVTTFFNPKSVDKLNAKPADKKAAPVKSFIDEGFNRIQYEIDRFQHIFPKPLDDAKALTRATVNVKAGEFKDCEVITGTSHYDGPLLNDGRSVFDGTYKITLHPKAPFGVVSMQTEGDGREYSSTVGSFKATMKLTLIETGTGAISELPKGSVKRRDRRRKRGADDVAASSAHDIAASIAATDRAKKTPTLPGWVPVSGKIVDPAGDPMPQVEVSFSKVGEQVFRSFLTNADGVYKGYAPTGDVEVGVFRRKKRSRNDPPSFDIFYRKTIEIPAEGGTVDIKTDRALVHAESN